MVKLTLQANIVFYFFFGKQNETKMTLGLQLKIVMLLLLTHPITHTMETLEVIFPKKTKIMFTGNEYFIESIDKNEKSITFNYNQLDSLEISDNGILTLSHSKEKLNSILPHVDNIDVIAKLTADFSGPSCSVQHGEVRKEIIKAVRELESEEFSKFIKGLPPVEIEEYKINLKKNSFLEAIFCYEKISFPCDTSLNPRVPLIERRISGKCNIIRSGIHSLTPFPIGEIKITFLEENKESLLYLSTNDQESKYLKSINEPKKLNYLSLLTKAIKNNKGKLFMFTGVIVFFLFSMA